MENFLKVIFIDFYFSISVLTIQFSDDLVKILSDTFKISHTVYVCILLKPSNLCNIYKFYSPCKVSLGYPYHNFYKND